VNALIRSAFGQVTLFRPESELGLIAARAGQEFAARPFRIYMAAVIAGSSFYYLVLAAPIYVSDTQFALRGKQAVPTVPLLAALTGQVASGLPESTALESYIRSSDMLGELDKRYDLKAFYSRPRLDFLNWMPADASQQKFLRFYNSMVTLDLDTDANLITVHVKSFDAASAQSIANSILSLSARFVDNLSREMRTESTLSAQNDFKQAQSDAIKARLAVADFRLSNGDLDPAAYGSSTAGALYQMQYQVVTLKTQLAAMSTYSRAGSPQVQQIQAQIANLDAEIAQTQAKMSGQNEKNSITKQINQYQGLSIYQTYADQRLLAAQAALDQAKSVANQRELFVVPVTTAKLPDQPALPNRPLSIFDFCALAAMLYAIGRFVLASIRDHQGG
jgi:capsular polysaccharide transport system permease protein